MKIMPTLFPEVLIIEPVMFSDARGQFFESFNKLKYNNVAAEFVQDNISISKQNVLRGLHFQHPHGQDKLVSVLYGEVLDVVVDIRIDSPTFGQSISVVLNDSNRQQ